MRKGKRYNSTQREHFVIRVLFALYFFLYFFCSQDAAISLAQHRLSGGQTAYHPLVGASVLTLIALCLQVAVSRMSRIPRRFYALTFVPAAACALLPMAILPFARGRILLFFAAGILAWGVFEAYYFFSRRQQSGNVRAALIPNLLISLLTTLYLGVAGYSDDVLTYEVKTARLLMEGKSREALLVGRSALATSPLLTALRAHAMNSRPGDLGNYLFAYPLPPGGSRNLYLSVADTSRTVLPKDSLVMLTQACLQGTSPDSLPLSAARRVADYHLCGLLLDKQLERFVEDLSNYYPVSDSTRLPVYYEQALVLYRRLYASGRDIGHINPGVIANYMDFKEKGSKYSDATVRRNYLRREYGNTYWWYYFYH